MSRIISPIITPEVKTVIVTLTSDFGLKDSYVAEMKGAILSRNPKVRFVDITHDIPPQNILHASLVLWRSYRYFPKGTIHLVVVDPGVGTQRRLVIGQSRKYYFVAPDNGILSPILSEEKPSFYAIDPTCPHVTPKRGVFSRSTTFAGRDILAPCAAMLSKKIPPETLGERICSIKDLPEWRVTVDKCCVKGRVLSKDHFGNIITNIREEDFCQFLSKGNKRGVWIQSGKVLVKELSKTYAEGAKGKPLALFGSSGLLELAVRDGNASQRLHLGQGSPVRLIYGKD